MTEHASPPEPPASPDGSPAAPVGHIAGWGLVTFREGHDAERAGALRGDGAVVELPGGMGAHGLIELLERWAEVSDDLRGWDPSGQDAVPDAALLAPLRYPRKVICAGVNYRSHMREMGIEPPAGPAKPFFFLKPPSTTVIGPRESIVIPQDAAARVDWEAELGVVVGRGGHDIAVADAAAHIAGYTIVNDVSIRGVHRREDPPAAPFEWDWVASKGADTTCPLGPAVVPSWLIADPQDLGIRLWVNGGAKQDSTTADMVSSIAELVSAASGLMTLEPGDVIATGTPPGVGQAHGRFLADGDVVTIEIEGLGALTNPVRVRMPAEAEVLA